MSDLDVRLRVRADGAGLVGQQVRSTADDISFLRNSVLGAKTETQGLDRATREATTRTRDLGRGANEAARGISREGQEAKETAGALDAMSGASNRNSQAAASHGKALQTAGRSAGEQRAMYQNLSFQIQDVTQQFALGVNPMTIFAQQGGQVAFALQGVGGKLGAVATFLSGPFGAAVLGGVTIIGAMATQLLTAGDASDTLADSQIDLKRFVDETTGSLRAQASAADLLATKLAAFTRIEDARRTERRASEELVEEGPRFRTSPNRELLLLGSAIKEFEQTGELQALTAALAQTGEEAGRGRKEVLEYALAIEEARADAEKAEATLAVLNGTASEQQKILAGATTAAALASAAERELAAARDNAAGATARFQLEQRKLEERLGSDDGYGAEQYKRDLAALEEVRDAEVARYRDAETAARQAEQAAKRRQNELQREAQAQARREQSLEAFLSGLEREAKLVDATADERERVEAILRAEEGVGRALTDGELERLETAIELRRQKEETLRVEEQRLEAIAAAVVAEQSLYDQFKAFEQRVDPEAAARAAQVSDENLLLKFREAFPELIDDARFQELWEKAGERGGKSASDAFMRESLARAEALGQLIGGKAGDVLTDVIGLISGAKTGDFTAIGGKTGGAATILSDIFGGGKDSEFAKSFKGVFNGLAGELGLDDIGGEFKDALNSLGIEGSLGSIAGRAGAGAAIGTGTDAVLDMLGLKSSGKGAQIGGALGSFIPIPGGEILGSVAGGLIGGLFGGGNRTARAAITGPNGYDVAGKDKDNYGAAGDLGGAVQDAVERIAQALGGELGTGGVTSIGTRGEEIRVNTGGTSLKLKNGARGFDQDAEAAVAYAVLDRIADGAVTGLSARIEKALKSSPDLDKALEEALQVQQMEELLNDAFNPFAAAMQSFEDQAAERVRIAREYGFDLVEIEKLNQEERLKLQDQLLDQQVGQLRSFLDDLEFGNLASGSANEQRDRLRAEIDELRADLDPGDAEANNRLADLLRRFVSVSQEASGTAGGFAADREYARAAATDVVSDAERQLRESEKQTKLLDEQADQLANSNAKLDDIKGAIDNLGGLLSGGGGGGIFGSGRDFVVKQRL